MADPKYAFQGMTESMAKAMKRDAEISFKVALEMASFLKGRKTSEAKVILERVLAKTQAIPFKRFTDGVGHRPGAGIAAGRYPQKGSQIFINLIKSAEANAQAKGLSSELKIIHIAPQKASGAFHHGRQSRRKFKRAHLELVIQEVEKESKKEKTEKKSPEKKVKAEKKTEEKESEPVEHNHTEHKHVEHSEHKVTHEETQSQTEKPKKKVTKKVAKKVEENTQEDKQ